MKLNKNLYFLSLLSLVIGILLMHYLPQVYFVGIIIFFVLIVLQTPNPKPDPTGETNDENLAILKLIGLNTILFLAGGYIAAIFL